MEVDEDEVTVGASRTARSSTRTAWIPRRSCASSRSPAAGPGKVVIVACEPQTIEEMGVGLSPVVEEAVDRAVELVIETAKELLTDEAYASLDEKRSRSAVHEFDLSSAIVATVNKHAARAQGHARDAAHRPAAPGRQGHARVLLRDRRQGHVCEGATLEIIDVPAGAALQRRAITSGRSRSRRSSAPTCGPGARRGRDGRGIHGRVDRSRGRGGRRMHRTKVRVVEDALDANNTIAAANRGDFDRANVTVVNLMSAPGRRQDDAARARARRPRRGRPARRRARGRRPGQLRRRPPLGPAHPRRAAQHRQRLRRRVPPRREHGPLGAAGGPARTRWTC